MNAPEADTRAASGEALPSLGGFGATVQAVEPKASQPLRARGTPVFDLCHVGVMLRMLLCVVGALGIGVGLGARDGAQWLLDFAVAVAHGLPAVIVWVAVGCVVQRLMAPRSSLAVQVLLSAWAAVVGGAIHWLLGPVRGAISVPWTQTLAAMAASAAMAAMFLAWMRQRDRLLEPAAASARLQELQSRIQPHFLFNTMNTAIALVRVDPGQAERVLEDLSELFRAALADAEAAATSSLADEIELARKYLAIESLRFGERLDVQWEIDPEANAALLPPLILQPLLENAVRHGVEPSPSGGRIRVRTRRRGSVAEVTVVNTVPEGDSTPGHGMALANVRERLALLHDIAAEFRAGRREGAYRVDITVPM